MMGSILEILLERISIAELLSYIVLKKDKKGAAKREGFSGLEIAVLGKREKTAKKIPKNIEETLTEEKTEEMQRVKVRYDLFIPLLQDKYDAVEVRYSAKKDKEEIDVILSKDAERFELGIDRPKTAKEEYSISFSYSREHGGYLVSYESEGYKERIDKARQDFTNRLDKSLEILPKSLMGGILGFTYLGSGKMARRDDLTGAMALMVDVHEAIHTPDEYETRVLTDWILRMEKPKYKN